MGGLFVGRRREEPWQERPRQRVVGGTPVLAYGVEVDKLGGLADASGDLTEDVRRDVGPRPPMHGSDRDRDGE